MKLFWRVVFYVVALHFIMTGSIGAITAWDDWHEALNSLRVFERAELGVPKATAIWLLFNTAWVWRVLALADLPALFLLFKVIQRSPKPKSNVAYLCFVLGIAAIHATSIAYLSQLSYVRTSQMTYALQDVSRFARGDLLFVFPAILFLGGGLVVGWRSQPAGCCPTCGYNLTANISGVCPECGTAVSNDSEKAA